MLVMPVRVSLLGVTGSEPVLHQMLYYDRLTKSYLYYNINVISKTLHFMFQLLLLWDARPKKITENFSVFTKFLAKHFSDQDLRGSN